MALNDITCAADLSRPIHDKTNAVDGWVSLEVSPFLTDRTDSTLRAVKDLFARAARPNVLIRIPGTQEGLLDIEEATFAGVPVNVTLLFSCEHYLAAVGAFLRGDGADDNRSWNCGAEGPSDGPAMEQWRNRQIKNFLMFTPLSLGVPMILMGDEVRRSQRRNAYCQDNELSWFDWSLVEKHPELVRFVKLLNAGRLLRDVSYESHKWSLMRMLRTAPHGWHGVKLSQPDGAYFSHSVAFSAELISEGVRVHMIWNAYHEPLDFELPSLENVIRGFAGSTPRWTRPTTLWVGERRRLFRQIPTTLSRDRPSCLSAVQVFRRGLSFRIVS